tara:strand:- start:23126 stop:23839 length:714 start_codon:yes stop_codon:yes gene_type:complete
MKTAICFTGTCRSLEYTHENIKNLLIETTGADVFLLIADNPHASKASEYFDGSRVKKLLIETEPDYNLEGLHFKPNWPPPTTTTQIYYKMIKSRQRCGEILTTYEQEQNFQYERVIFSRLDVKYFEEVGPVLNKANLNSLYVPDFHNTFGGVINGYNDRFAVGNRKNMQIYFNTVDSAHSFVQSGGYITAETLLKWHLVNSQVNVMHLPVRFTRVRPDGSEIDTRLKSFQPGTHRDS